MPYVVTRNSYIPGKKELNILDFLSDKLTLEQINNARKPAERYQESGTRTFRYKNITEEKLNEFDIEGKIMYLEEFYNMYGYLDVNNDNPEYNYELQVSIMQELRRDENVGEQEREPICIERLREKGYNFNPNYSTFFIPKNSSKPGHTKWRRIDAPSEELKKCLTNLKEIFERLMGGCYYHTAAFAYVHHRSIKDCVRKHANNKSNWFLKIDFSNFFGSTTPDFVMRMFSEIFPFSEIVKSERGKTALKNCLSLCFLNGKLPQGTPISPLITNIMMIPIDHHLANGLTKKKVVSPNEHQCGYVYTRYADDILVSNRFNFDHREIVSWIREVLRHFDAPFDLNDDKTRYSSNAGKNWMLGLMLNQDHEVTVGYKRKKQLKATIVNYMLDRKAGHSWCLEDVQHLQGEISYCKTIEPETVNHIMCQYSRKYGDVDTAIKADLKALA